MGGMPPMPGMGMPQVFPGFPGGPGGMTRRQFPRGPMPHSFPHGMPGFGPREAREELEEHEEHEEGEENEEKENKKDSKNDNPR